MGTWPDFLRSMVATILLVVLVAMPSVGLAHAGHSGAHVVAHAAAGEGAPDVAQDVIETAAAAQDGGATHDPRHRSCGGPCCTIACSTACASHALSAPQAALPPDAIVLARLDAVPDASPTDPPRRRLPKPPRT